MSIAPKFEDIWPKYSRQIMKLCLRHLQNQSDAEDVLQQIAMRIWRGLPSFQGRASLLTWIYKIAIGEIRRALKHKQSYTEICLDVFLPDKQFDNTQIQQTQTEYDKTPFSIEIIEDAKEKKAITETEYIVLKARFLQPHETWKDISNSVNVDAARCATEHYRAISKLRVFMFVNHPNKLGGYKVIVDAFTKLITSKNILISTCEMEVFKEIVIKRNLKYRKAGWQNTLRSICEKVIKMIPMP